VTATTGAPRSAPKSTGLRLAAAVAAGRGAAELSRRLGRGSGSTIGGRVTVALAPDALRRLSAGRRIAVVTGTNGKSTTTSLLSAALGEETCTNGAGANLPAGLVAALSASSAATAVLETDELYVPRVLRATQPRVLVLLNLSRDQLDRSHEVARVARRWRAGLADTQVTVVANAADPNVVYAVGDADAVWVSPATRWTNDAPLCPWCGAPLRWAAQWSCGCGRQQPTATVTVTDRAITTGAGTRLDAPPALPGDVNVDNAAFAVAAAGVMGVPPEVAVERMAAVRSVAGRYARLRVADRAVTLLLAKNPAGWAAALPLLGTDGPLAIGVNARSADGADTSWLWDVEFERLAGRVIGAFGERADDLALRLTYAGAVVITGPDLAAVAPRLPDGDLTVVANYTAFQEVRRSAC
jgi:UDP-N-acetylmuramyl tripeptide synthase